MGTSIFFPHQTVKMEQMKSSTFFAGRDEMFFFLEARSSKNFGRGGPRFMSQVIVLICRQNHVNSSRPIGSHHLGEYVVEMRILHTLFEEYPGDMITFVGVRLTFFISFATLFGMSSSYQLISPWVQNGFGMNQSLKTLRMCFMKQ